MNLHSTMSIKLLNTVSSTFFLFEPLSLKEGLTIFKKISQDHETSHLGKVHDEKSHYFF